MRTSDTTKTKLRTMWMILHLGSVALVGCSTVRDAGIVTAGAGAGAAAGYALGDKKPGAVAIGAAGGALISGAAVSVMARKDGEAAGYKTGLDDGYILGTADASKRLYFAKRALEERPSEQAGLQMSYYVWEEQGTTPDGRKLAPQAVAVPIVEAKPVK